MCLNCGQVLQKLTLRWDLCASALLGRCFQGRWTREWGSGTWKERKTMVKSQTKSHRACFTSLLLLTAHQQSSLESRWYAEGMLDSSGSTSGPLCYISLLTPGVGVTEHNTWGKRFGLNINSAVHACISIQPLSSSSSCSGGHPQEHKAVLLIGSGHQR